MNINKILISNRGEIALRIIRACRELNIKSVVVFSDIDRLSRHVLYADEAYSIGAPSATESYLRIDKIIEVAKSAGVDAIHPGYGFLSENSEFASEAEKNNIIFLGPSSESLNILGNKTSAKNIADKCGIDSVPGSSKAFKDVKQALKVAGEIKYPLLLKAVSGGGGKGMRTVRSKAEFAEQFKTASSEAESSFNDPSVFIEKLIEDPHHIEIQILADSHGNVVHLGERECSVQRRYQKIIEESPSPFITHDLREKMAKAAVDLAKAAKYESAGTVEFLVDSKMNYYFLEMNTRLQVEHPVTEMRIGIDLVKEQIRIGEGKKLRFSQEDISFSGHSIECRITAEDTSNDFAPAIGTIIDYFEPGGPGVRVDSGVHAGTVVSPYYDSLLSKVVVWGNDRNEALDRCVRALSEYIITGLPTSLPFCKRVLTNAEFRKGKYDLNLTAKISKSPNKNVNGNILNAAAIGASAFQYSSSSNNNFNGKASKLSSSQWKTHGRKSSLR